MAVTIPKAIFASMRANRPGLTDATDADIKILVGVRPGAYACEEPYVGTDIGAFPANILSFDMPGGPLHR